MIVDLGDMLACALALCQKYDASVTSWRRTRVHNAVVGGVPNSDHLTGCAVDLVYDLAQPPLADVQFIVASYGCGVLREKGHDHVFYKRDIGTPETGIAVKPGLMVKR